MEAENARLKMTLRMLQGQMASMRSNMHQAAGASGHGPHYQPLLMANPVYSNAKPQPQPQATSSAPREAEAVGEQKFSLPLDGGRNVCFAVCPTSPLAIYASCKQGQSEHGLCKVCWRPRCGGYVFLVAFDLADVVPSCGRLMWSSRDQLHSVRCTHCLSKPSPMIQMEWQGTEVL